MSVVLSPLPYEKSALEPHISARTLDFHHGKHHQAYVTNLNGLIQGTALDDASLEEIILASASTPEKEGIFNNAAQVWNHTFFWESMTPRGGGNPPSDVLSLINRDFGDMESFKAEFKKAATTQFGSGWAWLVLDQGKLKVTKTPNAVLPMINHQKALLTCDVWEHAYYLDYQNRRVDYVDIFLNNLVNWDFVVLNLSKAS